MKKLTLLIFLTCLSLKICLAQNDYFADHPFKDFSVEHNGLKFKVDPRIEFLQTLFLLAGNPYINSQSLDYKLAILERYSEYKEHPLMEEFFGLALKIFDSIDGPIFFTVQLTNDFRLRNDIDNAPWDGNENIDHLLQVMQALATEMDYAHFFNSRSEMYLNTLQLTKMNLTDFDEKRRLIDYYREEGSKYEFIVILNFLGYGNFGPRIQVKNKKELYAVISPSFTAGTIPYFDLYEIHYLVWHEFSHSFVNPEIDKHAAEFAEIKHLYEPIRAAMRGQAYHTWDVTLKEHLVRAVTCRLAADKYGEDYAHWNYVQTEKGVKYIYLPKMLNILKKYEDDESMAFAAVVPQIVNALKKIAEQEISIMLEEVETIREPNVDEIPAIGQARSNVLIVVPNEVQFPYTVKWPGEKMKKTAGNWYAYTFKNKAEVNVIFNNNEGTQTKDLLGVSHDAWYDIASQTWLEPDKHPDLPMIEKEPNDLVVYCKAPKQFKQTMIYYWDDEAPTFGAFISRYKNDYYSEAELIKEKDLKNYNLSDHDLIIMGTLKNNQILAKLAKKLPIYFSESGDIIGDRVYEGADLIFISGWLHPENPERKLELYLAKSLRDFINIDRVRVGGTNYHLTRGLITLKKGNYQRRNRIWRF